MSAREVIAKMLIGHTRGPTSGLLTEDIISALRARVARLEGALRSADALLCSEGYTVSHPVVQAIASALSAETPEKDSSP